MKKQLLPLILAATATASAWAVPARRGFVSVVGPDGQTIEVEKVGDEFGHHYVDRLGRTLVDDADGRLAFASEARISEIAERRSARFDARNMKRRNVARRTPGNIGTFPGTSFPATGKQKALVILVEYKDVSFTIGSDAKAKEYFTNMLNQDGFSEYGGTGCVAEYFRENSGGKFDCTFDVFGPVTLSQKRSYYGANDYFGNDKHPEEMVVEACKALDSQINFKDYDRDGDGQVDNVYVIYAGQGEASYGESETVWPHSWNLSEADAALTLDGVVIDLYGCSNEWEESLPDGMGTFTHEFSHILGLPDLYHTDSSSAFYTPGEWSVLDYGPYNNDGRTPPAYGAFERNALGWINLTELTANAGDVTLDDLLTTNTAYCITNPANAQEFYLLETRNKAGWDKYLPGAGMLIWHVDYNTSTWSTNSVNNTQSHQGVDLIEADGIASKKNRTAGDCFPGTSKATAYTPKWWNKQSVGFSLSNIARSGTKTTFSVGDGNGGGNGEDPEPPVLGDYVTVAEIIEMAPQKGESTDAVLRGYIVGYAASAWSAKQVKFTADGCNITTNIVLADDPDETDYEFCVPVQLKSKTTSQSELNLVDNPGVLGKQVDLTGSIEQYFGVPGFKSITAHNFVDESGNVEIEAPATDGAGQWFDLQGRPVVNPSKGLYIRDGRKYLLR